MCCNFVNTRFSRHEQKPPWQVSLLAPSRHVTKYRKLLLLPLGRGSWTHLSLFYHGLPAHLLRDPICWFCIQLRVVIKLLLNQPRKFPVPARDSQQGRDEGGKNANGIFPHRAGKLGATIHIYCHIRCNWNAVMAVRCSIWNGLFNICHFLMPTVHNKNLHWCQIQ